MQRVCPGLCVYVYSNATADEMKPRIMAELAKRPRDEWIARLNAADVPASPVQDYKDVAESEQLRVNGCACGP